MTTANFGMSAGWMRGRNFDLTFTVGIAAIALLSGLAVTVEPRMFGVILFLNLWLLGYQHVIATYTRLCFDRKSLAENRFLLFGLPPIVLLAVAFLTFGLGLAVVATVYFYWQWFHYTRQSWGIAQVYRRKAGHPEDPSWLAKAAFYLPPLWGILHRSAEGHDRFLTLPFWSLPVPDMVVTAAGIVAAIAVAAWIVTRAQAWRRGEAAWGHTLYLLTHHAIFIVAYTVMDDIAEGWLVINIWHNAQYVLFVWVFNAGRFRNGIDASAKFLSYISQPSKAWLYFGICVVLSTIIYSGIDAIFPASLLIAIYMSINFHHYVVDSVIWKVRKRPLRETLGLT